MRVKYIFVGSSYYIGFQKLLDRFYENFKSFFEISGKFKE